MLRSAKPLKLFAGPKLRRLRTSAGMSQAALATAVGLSPTYLNQIEGDQRPLPPPVLQRICDLFEVGVDHFGDADDLRAVQELREALGDDVFVQPAIDLAEIRLAVQTTPEIARRFVLLQRAYRRQAEELQVSRGTPAASASALGSYDEVREWVQSRRNHFYALDCAAEALFETAGLASATLREDLTRRLRDRHGFTLTTDPSLLVEGTFWRIERRAKRLVFAESASPESRLFWMAHLLAQIEQRRLIDKEALAAQLSSDEARALARIGLANYFAGALIMPYTRFLDAAAETRYDIERLQGRFGASFEQVCHRLSTMQRPGRSGVPFYFVKTDIAGNILKRSSATRFRFSQFGGPCPLWNVYKTFADPGQIQIQIARTPDDTTYLNIARTVGRGGGFHLARPRSVAVVLGCEIEHAPRTVYATGLDLTDSAAVAAIGPGCRVCERTNCRHRAMPPIGRQLDVGTEERGVVPYRVKV